MDIATIVQFGFSGVAAFGTVGAITFVKKDLTSGQKFIILAVLAFIYSFVPADLGNIFLNKAKDAIAIATSLTATYTAVKAVGK